MSTDQNCRNHLDILIDWLRSSWCNLLTRVSADLEKEDEIFTALIVSYCDRARKYHDLQHIYDILNLIERVRDKSHDVSTLQFAAWFHDYVYNPQASDNELKSAIAARDFLERLNINPKTIKAIEKIILSTKKHQPLIESIDNSIFLDVDLAVLGGKSYEYKAYSQKIRQEYGYLSDRDYQIGRKRVLTQFLARKRIYYTDYFYQKLEFQARKNVQTEIKQLDSIFS